MTAAGQVLLGGLEHENAMILYHLLETFEPRGPDLRDFLQAGDMIVDEKTWMRPIL